MKTIKNTDKIRVFGVTFKDIHEAISYAPRESLRKGFMLVLFQNAILALTPMIMPTKIGVIGTSYLQNRKRN